MTYFGTNTGLNIGLGTSSSSEDDSYSLDYVKGL